MSIGTWIYIGIEVASALGLIFLILMHSGKGGGLSDMFGGTRRARRPRAPPWWSATSTASRSRWPSSSPSPRSPWTFGCSDTPGPSARVAAKSDPVQRGAGGRLVAAVRHGAVAATTTTAVTYVGVAGGSISFGMTQSPTGCNPHTHGGRHRRPPGWCWPACCPARSWSTPRGRRRPTRT